MHDKTVTVFNRYHSKQLNVYTWYPHVISGAYFNADRAANIRKTGLETADRAMLNIPYAKSEGKIKIGLLEYLTPKEWSRQPNDMYAELVTFTEGTDFFLVGEYPEEPVNDADYYTGGMNGFRDYMNRNFDHVYLIKSVGKYDLIPHFELSGA